MNVNCVLCPVDFSGPSDVALRYASALASEAKARLVIVHVEETLPEYPADITGYGMGVAESNRIRLADLLAHIQSIIKGVDFEQRILKGDPAHEILRLAEREKIDLIVMGTHGRRGLSRLLMGSVAEWVMRRASCPVLTVRLPEITPEETHATQSTAASQ